MWVSVRVLSYNVVGVCRTQTHMHRHSLTLGITLFAIRLACEVGIVSPYTCVYVRVCWFICVCVCACMHVCMRVFVSECTCVHRVTGGVSVHTTNTIILVLNPLIITCDVIRSLCFTVSVCVCVCSRTVHVLSCAIIEAW